LADVRIIGGGLAGLVAAIECAERGVGVELHEATGKLGGRARSLQREGFITNQGPHAFYVKGPASAWLEARDLMPPLVPAQPSEIRLTYGGETRGVPERFLHAAARLRGRAPASQSFTEWARSRYRRARRGWSRAR
jgi:phytoene dehydrogenase-like protein